MSDDQFESLTGLAKAAGHIDLQHFLQALANEPARDPRGPLSEQELAESLSMLQASEADIAAGRTQDMRQAIHEIAEEYGLDIKR
ncbi:hypothetical protein [Aeoliella mucimassa]|uniref:hypothetical protein n=1 Tax=Aeoliella mucimassa TaxID=2527972 RepID=UPI00119E7D99|nr:hypothetical protein [Aeoliella mucimassa]